MGVNLDQIPLIQGQVHMTILFNMKHKPKLGINPLDSKVLIKLDLNRKNKLRVTPLDPKVLNSFNLNG
jgi:hypothetical protein